MRSLVRTVPSLPRPCVRFRARAAPFCAQAKAVRKHVEHIITLAKDGSLHKRRQAMAWVYDKDLVNAVFEDAPERYAEREGGYTRIIRYAPPRAAVGTAACAHPRLAHTHARGV